MKKTKRTELGRTIAVSALSIGLLSAAFVGLNSLVFASESSKTETLSPVKNAVDVEALKNTVSEDYQEPTLTVYDIGDAAPDVAAPDSERKDSAISAQEAAYIGAQYISEIFGESIDGSFVEMFYEVSSFTSRTYWTGSVAATQAELESGDHSFMFMVDAISGEKKNVHKFRHYRPFQDEEDAAKEPYLDDDEKSVEISIEYDKKRREKSRELYLESSEEFAAIAEETAQKHFKNTTVADVTYLEDRSNDGIVFVVTDDAGHEIEVAIHSDTKEVEFVDDRRDEIDPDFVPDPNGIG